MDSSTAAVPTITLHCSQAAPSSCRLESPTESVASLK